MLHIATTHHMSPRWIEIQARHIREHVSVPHRTWASIQLIDAAYGSHFDRVVEQNGPLAGKLNHLAVEISQEAADEDLLMFLDGDAFPIADPMPAVVEGLARAPLVAVRRAENAGDPQPHPCFCVTSVGAWRRLAGDWSDGYPWGGGRSGRVTDVGANLLRRLELSGTAWVQLLRSNPRRLDPLACAISGDTVYHHGVDAGGLSRAQRELAPRPLALDRLPLLGAAAARLERERMKLWSRRVQRRCLQRSELLYAKIAQGGSDWLADVC